MRRATASRRVRAIPAVGRSGTCGATVPYVPLALLLFCRYTSYDIIPDLFTLASPEFRSPFFIGPLVCCAGLLPLFTV